MHALAYFLCTFAGTTGYDLCPFMIWEQLCWETEHKAFVFFREPDLSTSFSTLIMCERICLWQVTHIKMPQEEYFRWIKEFFQKKTPKDLVLAGPTLNTASCQALLALLESSVWLTFSCPLTRRGQLCFEPRLPCISHSKGPLTLPEIETLEGKDAESWMHIYINSSLHYLFTFFLSPPFRLQWSYATIKQVSKHIFHRAWHLFP